MILSLLLMNILLIRRCAGPISLTVIESLLHYDVSSTYSIPLSVVNEENILTHLEVSNVTEGLQSVLHVLPRLDSDDVFSGSHDSSLPSVVVQLN